MSQEVSVKQQLTWSDQISERAVPSLRRVLQNPQPDDKKCFSSSFLLSALIDVEVEILVVEGDKGPTIIAQAKELEASILVIGQRKPSVLWRVRRKFLQKMDPEIVNFQFNWEAMSAELDNLIQVCNDLIAKYDVNNTSKLPAETKVVEEKTVDANQAALAKDLSRCNLVKETTQPA